jgi:hypothetical protein
VRRNARSSYRYKKPAWARALEYIGPQIRNKIPVIKQIRAFKSRREAFKRRVKGNIARAATFGYVKSLADPRLRPCKGVRKQIKRAYFGYKAVRNLKRGGNRTKDFRSKKVAKSRFTVLNCK